MALTFFEITGNHYATEWRGARALSNSIVGVSPTEAMRLAQASNKPSDWHTLRRTTDSWKDYNQPENQQGKTL